MAGCLLEVFLDTWSTRLSEEHDLSPKLNFSPCPHIYIDGYIIEFCFNCSVLVKHKS